MPVLFQLTLFPDICIFKSKFLSWLSFLWHLKRVKTILFRVILYITAFQILNLSIDIDYIALNTSCPAMGNFDDIDSFSEYILEKVTGDDDFTSEEDNDEGEAQNKGFEKYDSFSPLYFEPVSKCSVRVKGKYAMSWIAGLDTTNKTCKGYFSIISPPPKA